MRWMTWRVCLAWPCAAAHSELCWLLNCATPIGWLEKMIQFKEKARKQGEDVSVGLLDYPVLMAGASIQ